MNNNTIRKDVSTVASGDRFLCGGRLREIVRVRAVQLPVYWATVQQRGTVPGVELLHKCPHHPGVDYTEICAGAQISILIP